jgi:hypothetical protein
VTNRTRKLRRGTLDIEATLLPAINSDLKPPPKPGWLLRKKTNSDGEELRPILVMNGTENYKLAIEIEHNPGIYQPFIAVLDSGHLIILSEPMHYQWDGRKGQMLILSV